jgi:hypothetical protein
MPTKWPDSCLIATNQPDMSHKNKSAICGYLHIEGVVVGVVDPSDSESASRRIGRW